MTDQTPATEAGRAYGPDNPAPGTRLWRFRNYPETLTHEGWVAVAHDLDQLRAEARADADDDWHGRAEMWQEKGRADYMAEEAKRIETARKVARADALREAAERVRALDAPKRYENDANGNWFTTDMEYGWDCGTAAVLAILDPEAS